MDGFFKKANQKVNLGQWPMPAHLDIPYLKDRFLKNLSSKNVSPKLDCCKNMLVNRSSFDKFNA